jgi:dipeptidyl-peptidase 4
MSHNPTIAPESLRSRPAVSQSGIGSSASPENPPVPAPGDAGQDPSLLTLSRIFGPDKDLKVESWGPAYWLKDGSGYTTLEASENSSDSGTGKDIVRYDAESGEREVIVSATRMIPPGQDQPLAITDYGFSEGTNKVLIFANTKRVWRYETRGDYWVYDPADGSLRQLGGDAPPSTLMFATFSPDGTRVAYVCKHNLFVQSLDDLSITQLTLDGSATTINGTADWVNEEEFYLRNGLRWSPDGKSIAYWQFDTTGVRDFQLINNTDSLYPEITSFAYPKVGKDNSACRVGVVSASGGDTLWFQPNNDPRNHYIPRMEWSEDSQCVLFQQLNRLQNTNQVIAGSPATGATEAIFTDQDDAWVEVMQDWRWIEDGKRFLWLSDRDGWHHLYAVSRTERTVSLLTPGEFDVIGLAGVDEQLGCAYFIASPENSTQRHLYRAPLDGTGEVVRVSPCDEPGSHSYQFSKNGRWAFRTFSRFGQAPVVDLVSLPDHKVVRILTDNAVLSGKLADLKPCATEFFRVDIGDGVQLDAWSILPPDFDSSKSYPLLMHVYGEPAGTTVVDRWGGDNYLWHSMLAQRGYVVMSIDNRGTPAPRGRAWRKSVYRQIGILAPADQAAATREILRTRPYLDPARVGIWGHSGGGSMSLHAIFREPGLYRTAMALSFVANQRFYDTIYQERYMGLPGDNEEGYREGSPITHAHKLQGRLLLVYGTGDDNCHYQNCEVMINELVKHDKRFSLMSYPNRSHSIKEGENTQRHLYGTLTNYLAENLPLVPLSPQ